MRPELSIVLPVHDQADHIVEVVDLWRAVLKGRPWEVLLIPNGCRDNSVQLCRAQAKKDKKVRVVELKKGGWGLAVREGLSHAKGKFVGYTNSARTDPSVVPVLFEELRKSPGSLVKGDRRVRENSLRRIASITYNLENWLLFGTQSRDVNGTPKLFAAPLLGRMKLSSTGDLLDAEVLAWCAKLGVPLREVPLYAWARHGGRSTTKVMSGAKMCLGLFGLKKRMG
jgi:glycosyltransferase involved in cell wall biosynthesis